MNRQLFVDKLKNAVPMDEEHIEKVIADSINSTGNDGIHLIIAMEELSELQKEISKECVVKAIK